MATNFLVIGSGAREHAIARALHRSPQKINIYCFASSINPGIENIAVEIKVGEIANPDLVKEYSKKISADLAIVGPEAPLAKGVTDALWEMGVPVVGPTKNLACIETSKAFARNLLTEYKIPACPKYKVFSSMDGVLDFLKELGDKYVVKYDGLAGGKGVKVAGDHLHSHTDAIAYCEELIDAGGKFIVEEKLIGQEFSLMSFCDGEHLKHMPAVQDHKRAYAGDTGPNTGGMGTYSDADHGLPFLTAADIQNAHEINEATARALKDKFNQGYKGILYGGFIATATGVKLIEYNARFGDPEVMNVLPLLETDFLEICLGIVEGNLNEKQVSFKRLATVCKYAVPEGYPETPVLGQPINVSNVKNPENLFYASVEVKEGQLIETGSRTVAVVGMAHTIAEAEKTAEKEISAVKGPLFHRSDIGTEVLIQKRIKQMQDLRG